MAIYDPIMDALLAYLRTQIPANTFLSFQRGIVMWPELSRIANGNPVVRQPALFLYDGVGFGGGKTHYQHQNRVVPAIRTMSRTIVIYAKTPTAGGFPGGTTGGLAVQNTTTSQATLLHPLIEAVETAVGTPDDASRGTLTLGGLVAYCRIEGEGMVISPDIDENGQGMATLPVEIRLP